MISRLNTMALAAIVAVSFSSAPTYAATYSGITQAELIAVFENAEISVRITGVANVLSVSGSNVELAECNTDGRCNEIKFWATFTDVAPTLGAVNEWNGSMKIPEASRTSGGLLHMEMWMTAIGATDTSIVDTLKWFEAFAAYESFWAPYMSNASS